MKKLLLLTTLLFALTTQAQADYFTNCDRPGGIAKAGNFLYFVDSGLGFNTGLIARIDTSQATPTKTDIVTNLVYPRDIAIQGTDMYLIDLSGGLYKIDLTQTNPTPVLLQNVTGNTAINDRVTKILLHNNYIYLALLDQGKVIRVPLNDTATSEDLVTGLQFPHATAMIGNELYYTDFISGNGHRLFKVDIAIPNATPIIVENTLASGNDIFAVGTDIYTVHGAGAKRITRTDTTANLPTHEEFLITGIDTNSEFIFISGTDVYISTFQSIAGRIQRYTLNTLSISENETPINVKIYPNPTTTQVTISLENNERMKEISIFNTLGMKVKETQFNTNSEAIIDLSNLSKGVYILNVKTENKTLTKKIIKE